MRAHRGKQYDWTKPFKLVDSKTEFDELETNENELVISFTAKNEAQVAPIQKKQQIIVPKIQTVRRITEVKPFAKICANYHRITNDLNLPKLMNYELNEVDHMFLHGHANRFKFNNKVILNPEFLSKTFVEMELRAGKDPVLPKNKSWMMDYLKREHAELLSYPNIEQFAEVLYNYWKNRRQEVKFPLLRSLWRPNPEEYNHLLAFKPREKEKRNLRRTTRLPEDEIAQELQDEFALSIKIVQRIKAREEAKSRLLQFQMTSFHNEYKQYFGSPDFFEEFNTENRNKEKQKIKKLNTEFDQVKKQYNDDAKNMPLENFENQTYDQKLSVTEFLSTVVHYADTFAITYEKIFNDRGVVKHIPVVQQPDFPEEPIQQQKSECINMKLYKEGDTIYRTLMTDDSQEFYQKPPTSYLDHQVQCVKAYFFGDDDQGDFKDIKKNVSQNFKKFLNSSQNKGE